MDLADARTFTHAALFSLCTALVIAMWLARGNVVQLRHMTLGAASLVVFGCWVFLLALSVRDNALLARDDMIPLLLACEASGTLLGWAWFVLMARSTFEVVHRREVTS